MNKGKKNLYVCNECGHGFVSQDRDQGTTPFITNCINCGENSAMSFCYNVRQDMLGTPAVLWIKPNDEERSRISDGYSSHLDMGGLIRSDTPGLVIEEPETIGRIEDWEMKGQSMFGRIYDFKDGAVLDGTKARITRVKELTDKYAFSDEGAYELGQPKA